MKKRIRIQRPERDRALFTVLRLVRGKTDSEAVGTSGVSPQTMRKWRMTVDAGGTRFPQFFTMDRVLRANGYCFQPSLSIRNKRTNMTRPVPQRTEIVGIMVASFVLVTSLIGFVLLLIDPAWAERFLLWEAIILILALLSLWVVRMVLAEVAANRGSFRTED